jgi:hypothetical protein
VSPHPDPTLDFDALVSLITEAVLGRLQGATPWGEAAAGGGAAPSAPAMEARRIGWLLAAPCGHLDVLARQVSTLARLGHAQLVVACADVVDGLRSTADWPGEGPGLGLRVVGTDGGGVSALLAELRDQDVIYVGALGWRQATALAELDDGDGFVQLLLGALAAGKPVSVVAGEGLGGLHGLATGAAATAAGYEGAGRGRAEAPPGGLGGGRQRPGARLRGAFDRAGRGGGGGGRRARAAAGPRHGDHTPGPGSGPGAGRADRAGLTRGTPRGWQ